MKTIEQWLSEYDLNHQNKTNIIIHYICVPAIYFSVIGLFMSIPPTILSRTLNLENPLIENWGAPISAVILLFYVLLSIRVAIKMLLFSALCILGNYYLSKVTPQFNTALILLILGFIGQFYGHFIERNKPSFLKDVQFLLIGPAWVIKKIFG